MACVEEAQTLKLDRIHKKVTERQHRVGELAVVLVEGPEFPTLFTPQIGMEPQGRACPGST